MNRHDRRKANKGKPKIAVTFSGEVFTTPNLGDREISLDVGRMRAWAKQNAELQKIGKHSRRTVWLLSGQNVYRVSLWTHTKTLAVFKFCRSLIPAVVGVGRMTRKSASLRKVMAVA